MYSSPQEHQPTPPREGALDLGTIAGGSSHLLWSPSQDANIHKPLTYGTLTPVIHTTETSSRKTCVNIISTFQQTN